MGGVVAVIESKSMIIESRNIAVRKIESKRDTIKGDGVRERGEGEGG